MNLYHAVNALKLRIQFGKPMKTSFKKAMKCCCFLKVRISNFVLNSKWIFVWGFVLEVFGTRGFVWAFLSRAWHGVVLPRGVCPEIYVLGGFFPDTIQINKA